MQISPYPPAFENIGEGLAYLDEVRDAKIQEMEDQARELMELDQDDPSKQNYFIRTDRGTVVKTEEEYVRCQLAGVRMRTVPYAQAIQALKEQDARKRTEKKLAQKKKTARKARKRNR